MSTVTQHYFFIDSSNRNVTRFPNVNQFTVDLDRFKNIISIELVNIVLPLNAGDIYNQGALIIKLEPPNLNSLTVSKNSSINYSSFVVFPDNPATSNSTTFATIAVGQTIEFPSKQTINRQFGMSFYKPDGSLYSFGETGGDLTIAKNIKALFKIKFEQNK